jgi:hypothetical protein
VLNILFSINTNAYIEIIELFGIFFYVEGIDDDILREKPKQLVNIYSVHSRNLRMRLYNFKKIMKFFSEDEKLSMHSFLEVLTVSKLNDSFPIVEIAL